MSYVFKPEDAFALARQIGADTKQKGDELFFAWCPHCHGDGHDKDTFSINLVSGCFKCFRASCDYHGHFVELARDCGFEIDSTQPKIYKVLPQRPIEVRDGAVEFMATRGISERVCKEYCITTSKDNKNTIVFPFYDEKGVLQFVKYRNAKFRPGVDKNKEWTERDTMPILFGMKQCIGFDRLIITEGQIDSLTLAECGVKNAVSVPTGANGFTWLANVWDWITRFREVISFGDSEKGKLTLADTLRARLPMTVKVVRKVDYLGEKDANDILRAYGKQAVLDAVANAEEPRIENVKDLYSVRIVDVNNIPKIKTGISDIDKIVGGLVAGTVTLLTGKQGNGKSTFMSQVICEALNQNENVFVYSGELQDFVFRRWIDYQLAGSDNIGVITNEFGVPEYTLDESISNQIGEWYKGRAYIYDNAYIPDDDKEMESLPDTIERVIKQYGCKLVCIDNLMTAMDAVRDDKQLYLAQSNFVGRIKKIAIKYAIAIVLVAHPRKSNNEFSNDDVSGSADITNKVDVVMSYKRVDDADREKDPDIDYDCTLEITKNRNYGRYAKKDKAIKLCFSQCSKRVYQRGDRGNKVYGWAKDKFIEIPQSVPIEIPF